LIALGLIGGGILGNLVDRVVRGCVVDFLYLHWRGFSLTYVFNIADAAICVGVVCYILALLVPRKSAAPPHQPAASTTAQT
jgi:signal peptidase II